LKLISCQKCSVTISWPIFTLREVNFLVVCLHICLFVCLLVSWLDGWRELGEMGW
jgi:hypothetical protein